MESPTTTPSASRPDWLLGKVDDALTNAKTDLDIPRPTEHGGYSHTASSKAKISAANKGKTPWNKGKGRSEEVKARIAAGVRKRNREKFLEKLRVLGVTEEEYDVQKKNERAAEEGERRARRTENGGYRPTEETRKKISQVLKDKWASGSVKKRVIDPSKVRRGFTHSEETRAKISASLRKRWATDENYRLNMVNKTHTNNASTEVRQKISETLKKKWEDPKYRASMKAKMATRKKSSFSHGPSHRQKISAAIKAKWKDKEYREKATAAMAKRQAALKTLRPPKIKKPRATAPPLAEPNATVTAPKPKLLSSFDIASGGSRVGSNDDKKLPVNDPYNAFTDCSSPRLALPLSQPKQRRIKGFHKQYSRKRAPPTDPSGSSPIRLEGKSTKKKNTKFSAKASISPAGSHDDGGKGDQPLASGESTLPSTKKAKNEASGSVSRLREERRDLYDLLYGDEEDENRPASRGTVLPKIGSDTSFGNRLSSIFFEDEDLDDFDPYGLEDF